MARRAATEGARAVVSCGILVVWCAGFLFVYALFFVRSGDGMSIGAVFRVVVLVSICFDSSVGSDSCCRGPFDLYSVVCSS